MWDRLRNPYNVLVYRHIFARYAFLLILVRVRVRVRVMTTRIGRMADEHSGWMMMATMYPVTF